MSKNLCTVCEKKEATTSYGFPVCEGCYNALVDTDLELKKLEAKNPELTNLEREVQEIYRKSR